MNLLVSCLESSANLHLGHVLKYLPNVKLSGIFDTKFGKALYDSKEFSAMGFVEVLPLIFKAKKAMNEMLELAKDADAILLIDSPAFNMRLLKKIKAKYPNKKIFYYILPQVWAWKEKRAKILDEMDINLISIWPFEKNYYKSAKFLGHPLLDEIQIQKNPNKKFGKIAFLPGSRRAEISNLMPIFKRLAPKLEGEKLLVVPKNLLNNIEEIYGEVSEFKIVSGTSEALANSDFAFICSGTATLEAALIGIPFVLCYKAKAIDVWLARKLVKLKHAGLANIIFDFNNKPELHKELIQEEVNVKNLLKAYEDCQIDKFQDGAKFLRSYLQGGSAKNLADLIKS